MKKNKRNKLLTTLFLVLLLPSLMTAQGGKIKQANKYFRSFEYEKAIRAYKKIKRKTPEVYRNLAKSYLILNKPVEAKKVYDEFIEKGNFRPGDLFTYAQILLRNKQYEEAIFWVKKYYELNPNDRRAKAFLIKPTYYKSLLKLNPKVRLRNSFINSKYSDFSPVFYRDTSVVFASSRGDDIFTKKWEGNDQPYLDLYIASILWDGSLDNVRKFNKTINKKYHDAPATFDSIGAYMMVTRNIYGKKNLKDVRLWLYESFLKEGNVWENPIPININDKSFSNGHASLSPDGKLMYFVSDRPGGYGGTDIYISRRNPDGSWSEPENVGPTINSEGNEMFPYYDAEGGHLFFSSDGWPGLGGLDIFVSKIKKDGTYSTPKNMGAPINSNYDDFAFIYKKNKGGFGFISSNRPGGKGDDDIYIFRPLPVLIEGCYVGGKVINKKTNEPIEGATVTLLDKDGEIISVMESEKGGFYRLDFDCKKETIYEIVATKDGFVEAWFRMDTRKVEPNKFNKDLYLVPIEEDVCATKLPNLYYDYDKHYIRDKDKIKLDQIAQLLKQHPDIKIIIASHTDSRASQRYNLELSRKRTMSAINYLLNKGIKKERLIGKWYGEIFPVNRCIDGVECSEEEYQMNRRTEFIIDRCLEKWKKDYPYIKNVK